MNLAKVSANGQENAIRIALKDVQAAFQSEAERLGLKNEQDVAAMINEFRREKR